MTARIAERNWAWQDDAVCRAADPHVFFPAEKSPVTDSMAEFAYAEYCQFCPVRTECLDAAMSNHESGIWAGTTEEDRRKLAAGKTRAKCPVCLADSPVSLDGDQVCRACGHSWRAAPVRDRSEPEPSTRELARERRAEKDEQLDSLIGRLVRLGAPS